MGGSFFVATRRSLPTAAGLHPGVRARRVARRRVYVRGSFATQPRSHDFQVLRASLSRNPLAIKDAAEEQPRPRHDQRNDRSRRQTFMKLHVRLARSKILTDLNGKRAAIWSV